MAKKAVDQFLKNIQVKCKTEWIPGHPELQSDPNVDGVTIVHKDGIPVKSSLDNTVAVEVGRIAPPYICFPSYKVAQN